MLQPLSSELRSVLEKTIVEARRVAEAGASAAVQRLGVHEAVAYPHLNQQEREIRRRLRARARQLGDTYNRSTEIQEVSRLIHEVAYEHWHRMLFARFLAENDLLMYPDPVAPIPLTLEECADLAASEGAKSGWELAARYATNMLPQIFRVDSPVFQLELPPEHQAKLESLLSALSGDVFQASDSLGWVYQFWQTKQKEEINNSEQKRGAREIPAVTQLFTEPYMVSFLLDNSLGAWWAARYLNVDDLRSAGSEDELRRKASLPGMPLTYLRFVREGQEAWQLAAGSFSAWPDDLAEFKLLDPCCGSGHFLVAALQMLVPLRMEMEGLSAQDAVEAVLRDNLFGLDIDPRVVEIAAFGLALAAWCYPDAGGYRQLPTMQLACSGLAVSVSKAEWSKLARGEKNLSIALNMVYEEFQKAPTLGSLLNPAQSDAARVVPWDELTATLSKAFAKEQTVEEEEAQIVAHGLARAASLLTQQYHLVITNVPYLARGKQGECLRQFAEDYYPVSKNDLATVFLERCLQFCVPGGTASLVLPQNWLFLTTYRKLREKLLKEERWHMVARLGAQAFQTPMWDFNVQLLTVSRRVDNDSDLLSDSCSTNLLRGLDVSDWRSAAEKAAQLLEIEIKSVGQPKQLRNPDAKVILDAFAIDTPLLGTLADVPQGVKTGDDSRFRMLFWERRDLGISWRCYQSSPTGRALFSGMSNLIRWDNSGSALARLQGSLAWGKKGIAVSKMSELPWAFYHGHIQDSNVNVIVPKNARSLKGLLVFVSSPEFSAAIRAIDQSLAVTNATFEQVPFDLDYWTEVAAEKYPNGLPQPFSDDPTQWIFHGHPCGSVLWDEEVKWTVRGPLRRDDTVLQVTVARLLGYRWPAELDKEMELAKEARALVEEAEKLLPYADHDGIVCIPAVLGERRADERLESLLAAAYGDAWSQDLKGELLASVGYADRTLENWLRDGFFGQHCQLFKHRPFVWHIWDGSRDGFAALVNYHRLDRKLLESLIYTYLGDWIARQKVAMGEGIDGAEQRLIAAENLKARLELILEGEKPYDIFVRWKPFDKQPIGWEPDLNDGVRLNIRPFMTVPDVGRKDAGVLREKPNVKWGKDRGKDVESAPWFHKFKGERINDYHLSLAEKRRAQQEGGLT